MANSILQILFQPNTIPIISFQCLLRNIDHTIMLHNCSPTFYIPIPSVSFEISYIQLKRKSI